jgi:asparagine synthase (glutamine-hydrolysing)
MCGILGIVKSNDYSPELDRVKFALGLMRHRGPDAQEIIDLNGAVLCHARLKIIDLTNHSAQPFFDSSGRYTLIFNGEIYNYIEIREELKKLGHRFRTKSDTEVLLAAYIEWGSSCLEKCNGMFAFCIYDTQLRSWFIARDRFGVKPLYWAQIEGGCLAFSSEVKPLLFLGASRKANIEYLESYIAYAAADFGAETMLEDIHQLPAGSYMNFTSDNIVTTQRWWDYRDYKINLPEKYNDRVDEYLALLMDSVRIRLRSDVPNAMTLSGGMDSTSIFGCYHKLRESGISEASGKNLMNVYTIDSNGASSSELEHVRLIADHYKHPFSTVCIDKYDALQWIWESIYALEFPAWNLSSIAYLQVYKAIAKSGAKVLLEGHGNDEILGGYHSHVNLAISSFLNSKSLSGAINASQIFSAMRNQEVGQKHVNPYFALVYNLIPGLRAVRQFKYISDIRIGGYWDPQLKFMGHSQNCYVGESQLTTQLFDDFQRSILPTVLRVFDRATMSSSIEMRAPFLDYRLVQYGFSIPDVDKIGGGYQKRILRDAMRGIVPEEIRTNLQKTAYSGNLLAWFNSLPNQRLIKEKILNSIHSGMPLSKVKLIKYFDEKCATGFDWNEAVRFSRALSVVVWWNMFVDGQYLQYNA